MISWCIFFYRPMQIAKQSGQFEFEFGLCNHGQLGRLSLYPFNSSTYVLLISINDVLSRFTLVVIDNYLNDNCLNGNIKLSTSSIGEEQSGQFDIIQCCGCSFCSYGLSNLCIHINNGLHVYTLWRALIKSPMLQYLSIPVAITVTTNYLCSGMKPISYAFYHLSVSNVILATYIFSNKY